MTSEELLVFVLAALAVIVAVRWCEERFGVPSAALLTVIGILYALAPGPNVALDPHIVLMFVVPPLLYSAALDSSLLAIRQDLRIVVSLSVLLVVLTALLIGVGFQLWVGGATLAAGVALGSAVAPPDPVAALAVGRRAGLPPRLITVIQGEGLLNDATALTLLTVAVSAAVGSGFSPSRAAGLFLIASLGGVGVGIVVALVLRAGRKLLIEPLIATAVSLGTPFVAYLVGEALNVSGVLAVVIAGLFVAHDGPRAVSGASRMQTAAVWRLVSFLLEGFVFLLIGQQLPSVVRGLAQYDGTTIAAAVGITLAVVLLLRPAWLLLTQSRPRSPRARLGRPPRRLRLSGREVAVLSWSGTRGVITLAAIFTLPLDTDAGTPFPDRDLLLLCAFLVVLVTLVGQGLTFAALVRALGLRANAADQARLRNEARADSVRAALARLDQLPDASEPDLEPVLIDTARQQLNARLRRYTGRLELLQDRTLTDMPVSPQYDAAVRIRQLVIDTQREELLRRRDTGQLPDASLRILQRELDHEELLLPDRPA